ncbi:uncharacterized membrane protein YhaH (DUF805 family) [Stenotrophomonas sp. PvP093]|jgi:hypothetical protein|uniref:DUF805 domain-containing protein n=2 Tax=Pseudomonadota TaxID=1224 RepID=UPI0007B2E86B|nr:DUF805 domain-containing protein [Stenotrophomonas sp. PvP093]KZE53894.1 hypothetical protein AVW14_08960 [Stenotrophomonas maltophilia]TGR53717.1 DUF805 domain-containing protein [bacterium M00.F.Ca.ET.199.01.1.1]TGT07582.1 DUF805 domain-containing protein [bacterium M00.F.Ca.ET.177.01.1.1]TGT64830.1 DUF805 domain-containing protein [Mesorhizobium sp. M00.F.Ca.ET.170.01.1.1]TGU14975.1 DUF805 domain-containing protein [bacterium M00.F.Ca.ET.163.01.1.1]TGU97686.1 DUF805 domain-containing pr
MIAALAPLGRCLDFSGRSDRIEFWSFSLLGLLVAGLSYSLMNIGYWLIGTDLFDWELSRQLGKLGQVLAIIALLVFLPPMLALAVRRLHDIDESGWYVVIAFIPLGVFVLFPVMLLPGSEEENRFG